MGEISYLLNVSDVPLQLQSDLEMLQRAFPEGVSESEYLALLAAIDAEFSNRNLADLVAAVTGRHPIDVDNDHAAAMSVRRPSPQPVREIQRQPAAEGFDPTRIEPPASLRPRTVSDGPLDQRWPSAYACTA